MKKYKLPPTHEAFFAYTPEELWVEFYEDYFEENPNEAFEISKEDDVQFVTGDDSFDEVERRLADGSMSLEELDAVLDGWEGKTPKKKQEQNKARASQLEAMERQVEEIGEGFSEGA